MADPAISSMIQQLARAGLVVTPRDTGRSSGGGARFTGIRAGRYAGIAALTVNGKGQLVSVEENGGGGTPRQETIAAEDVTGSDTILSDGLTSAPSAPESVSLYLNGVFQGQGSDYRLVGATHQQIEWLAGTGTAVDLDTSDVLEVTYSSG